MPVLSTRAAIRRLSLAVLGVCGGLLAGCADQNHQMVISVPEQRMVLIRDGIPLAIYPVSTSRFGVGDRPGTCETPLGTLEVARKIGDGLPPGAAFKSREPTGEVVAANAPGRDTIVSRILWLRGLDAGNRNAYGRYIYIHGTAEERNVGRPVSYGCIRMRSRDVIALYDEVGIGAKVFIRPQPLNVAAAPLLVPEAIIPQQILASAPTGTPAPSPTPTAETIRRSVTAR